MKAHKILSTDSVSHETMSVVSLILRLVVGGSMLAHGIPKIMAFSTLATTFPDPIGLGPAFSLVLTICAEVGCSVLLIFGLLTRLAAIPLVFNMAVIFFIVLKDAPFTGKEIALLYLIVYVAILILGGGRYSLDRLLFRTK